MNDVDDKVFREIMDNHVMRLDTCKDVPMKRRPYRARGPANTAIIAIAAKQKMLKKQS